MSADNRLTSIVSYPERGTGGNNRYRGNCSPKLIEDLIGFSSRPRSATTCAAAARRRMPLIPWESLAIATICTADSISSIARYRSALSLCSGIRRIGI